MTISGGVEQSRAMPAITVKATATATTTADPCGMTTKEQATATENRQQQLARLSAFFCKLQNLFDLSGSSTYYCAHHFHSFLVIRGILVPGHSGC
jgi:hypothetical protein